MQYSLETIYILPMLGLRPEKISGFVDTLISNNKYPLYDNHIHIVVDPYVFKLPEFKLMQTNLNFVTSFNYSTDEDLMIMVFKVPHLWRMDYVNYIMGDYDNFSVDYRNRLNFIYPELNDFVTCNIREGKTILH